ncbi:protein rep, partial [Escherichia coli]
RGSDGSAHPHFHTLMMAPPGMLNGKSYVRHERWVELWRECLRGDYDPNVDVRAVKPRKPKDGESLACATAEL